MAQPQPPGARFHPAKEVDIPKNQVTNLENKLNSTINEIDRLNEDIARGELTATMLSWNELTSRYTSILGRLADLTSEVNKADTRPPKPGFTPLPGAITSHYLVHPLHAVPPNEMDQLQAINTMPYPGSEGREEGVGGVAGLLGSQLGRMDPEALNRHIAALRAQWEGENGRARGVLQDVEGVAGEYDWKMRVENLENDGGSEDEDLFGDGDDDEDMDKEADKEKKDDKEGEDKVNANPREGWGLADYLNLMDTGKSRPVPT